MSASFVYWKPAQSCVLSSTVLSERASPWGLSSWVAHEKVTSTVFGTSLSLSASSSCSFLCSGCSHIYSSTIWDCLKSRSFLGSSCSVKKKTQNKTLTFSLLYTLPGDEILRAIGAEKCLLDLHPMGLWWCTGVCTLQLRHGGESKVLLQALLSPHFSNSSPMCLDSISTIANTQMEVGRDEHVEGNMNRAQPHYVSFLNIIPSARQK